MEGNVKGSVCVTGGTGYLASWLIMRLLQDGYKVHTTIRSYPDTKKDISFLTNLPGATRNLQIFSVDLDHPVSFGPAIKGCTGVFHVATPIDFEEREPEQVKTQRSINGTLGILKACLDSKTVKRVVYTSSTASILFNEKREDFVDESDWSDEDYIRSLRFSGASYAISKTLTEKAALEFAEKHGLDLVTVLPTFIHGPFICPQLPGSVKASMAMVFGDKDQYKHLTKVQMVHVDDVAKAHIFLLEYPEAKGRYICTAVDMTMEEMSEFLLSTYPEYPIPTPDSLKEIERFTHPGLSSKKLLETGFKYNYGMEDIFDEAIKCCKEKGFL